jgi:DNA modification methylase
MFIPGEVYERRSLHSLHGGQQRGGISTPSGRDLILLFTGEQGRQYGYRDGWSEDGLFLYTGEGQTGDMTFARGNLAVRDHVENGKDIHLFEYVRRGYVRYVGQMVCTGFHERRGPDRNGDDRRVIVFELAPLDAFIQPGATDHEEDDTGVQQEPLHILRERAISYAPPPSTPCERKALIQNRSNAIRTYVLKRAGGVCEACGQPAPFRTSSGRPYLEPHHIRRLSDGGPDHPQWIVVLCPNCHRRAHYSEDKVEFNRQLTDIVAEKENHVLKAAYQMALPLARTEQARPDRPYREQLVSLLSEDLDFHSLDSGYASHNFHSFPAKFPPQLPRKFINGLTNAGDVVLDPMVGSGTTVLEALLAGRNGVGFDIDPLALLVSKVKVTSLNVEQLVRTGSAVLERAKRAIEKRTGELQEALSTCWDPKTRKFVDYWFAPQTQLELLALITEIQRIDDAELKAFLGLAFSAVIITKSGGVSLAFDLAHTRPHRAKVVLAQTGEVVLGHDLVNSSSPRVKLLTKTLRSPLDEFKKRLQQNVNGLQQQARINTPQPCIAGGDAQSLPLDDASVDLIVTSPPYAANAIDYMRAHKFSLVWMGYPIDDLGQKRKEYIGGEAISQVDFEPLPDEASSVVTEITKLDDKKGRILHRYYSEMTRTLREMLRVLKPGSAAIVVVGNSVMRGRDTETPTCLADIGRAIGFQVPGIGVRHLDRNRRMMPAGFEPHLESQIEQRMHEEYVIGFYKPEA